MGMYPEYKEIPADLLARLLERPRDGEWVDGLLFDGSAPDSGWSAAMSCSILADEELRARFTWPRLTFSAEQRRRLGHLGLGKYPDPDWFSHLLSAADTPQRIDLTGVLSADWDERNAAWAKIVEVPVEVAHHSAYRDGDAGYGFRTDVPCYGISGYRTTEDLTAVWDSIERVLASYPELAPRIVEEFEAEIRYYHGCVARGSADLSVCW
ncbi:hypothetical protein KZZ52_45530 [Dactylosporangium sp. AC04546]|uniref:hypothetical protein n=1 Tax=Dactylosporangium sp. AC04546 TaxID=2862460 RepID=UPI001EE04342|nr:hypothetical protein [Dactylosporangium sp. AC04546]WVK81179.1 hypothetical protein KZZ52_45530 [Dactylosporangium sp. AC04546]